MRQASLAACLMTLLVSAAAVAETHSAFPDIQIENFGQINSNYYRGAQPQSSDYAQLAALGVKSVIDLTQDHWTAENAYDEMKQYRFEGFPGHPELKKFVYDYYTQTNTPKLLLAK